MITEGNETRRTGALRAAACALAIIALLVLCWIQLDMSSQWETDCFSFLQTMPIEFMVLSVLTLGALLCVVYALCGSLTASGAVLATFSTLVAVANYYVIEFHGSPLSFLELKNFGTAANMMGSYSLDFSATVSGILSIFLVELVIVFLGLKGAQKRRVFGNRSWKRSLGLLVAAALIVFVGYLSPASVKPARVLIWNWTTAYPYYGYVPCTVDTLQTCFNLIEKPEGYSEEALGEIEMPDAVAQTATPDIVIILNETFYDLHQIREFATDVDYLENIHALANAQCGYAVVPSVGGGTNKTEYELLTGNSMAPLAQSGAPFFTVDMTDAASIVTLLEAQGYETTAAHPRDAINYSRNVAYPAMGFDHVYFRDSFEDLAFSRGRWYETDESTYANVIRWYEENLAANEAAGVDKPQLMYCLTIQNHGDWNSSDAENDTVHAVGDFGIEHDTVNEYLTGIAESDAAFAELVDYFEQSERPTIVLMVGDHAPSFAAGIADDERYDDDELDLRLRSVPYVIWANYDLGERSFEVPERVSTNHLAPAVAQLANVGLSPYYAYELELMQGFPIVTTYGVYYDADGTMHRYDDDCDKRVTDYRYLDYANIIGEGDPSWFAY